MTITDFLAVVSLTVGVGAIALAFVFYRWTDTALNQIRGAADSIKASNEKLEKLFDKMFSTTFAAMNDANAAIRENFLQRAVNNEDLLRAVSDALKKGGIVKEENAPTVSREVVSDVAKAVIGATGSTDGHFGFAGIYGGPVGGSYPRAREILDSLKREGFMRVDGHTGSHEDETK